MKSSMLAALVMATMGMPVVLAQSADDAVFQQAQAAYGRGDYAAAKAGWESLAAKGQGRAMEKLAWSYLYAPAAWGNDKAKSRDWYKRCVDTNETECLFAWGWELASGRNYPKELEAGLALYRRAAEKGHGRAMNNLAWHYDAGEGVIKDQKMAFEWYRKAAEAGDTLGMANLAYMHSNGVGTTQDSAQALRWNQRAAEGGERDGMINLGVAYEMGKGVPQDLAKARYWYEKAGALGSAIAKEKLARLPPPPADVRDENTLIRDALARDASAAYALGQREEIRKSGMWKNSAILWYQLAFILGHPDAARAHRNLSTDPIDQGQFTKPVSGPGAKEFNEYRQQELILDRLRFMDPGKRNLPLAQRMALRDADMAAYVPLLEQAARLGQPDAVHMVAKRQQQQAVRAAAEAVPGAPEYQQARALLDKAIQAAKDVGKIQFGFGKGDERSAREKQEYFAVANQAIPLLDKSVALGNQDAMETYRSAYCGGFAIYNLNFVERDAAKCRDMSMKLAAAGNTEAMLALGRLAKQEGPSRDLNAAREWFEKAEAAGNKRAYVELGDLYLPRWNLLSDAEKARYWYARGAAKGDSYSREKLDHYFPRKAVLSAAQQDFIALIESVGPDTTDPGTYLYDAEMYCRMGGSRCNEFRGKAVRFEKDWNARAEQANMARIRNLYRTSPADSQKTDARTKCLQQRSESIRRATYGQQDWYYDTKC